MKKFTESAFIVALIVVQCRCLTRCEGTGKEDAVKVRVFREDDRAVIEGVEGWGFAERGSSVHAAQEAVMRAIGEDVSYGRLVGVSGLAFRMQVSKEGLCPSSPHSFCGFRCVARSTSALPWEVRIFEVKPDDLERVEEVRRAVVASIDRGVPVQYGSEEDGVIVGYQRGGQEWICLHPMHDAGKRAFIETKWPWGIAVFTEPKREMPSRRELALGALKQAVEMANAEEAENYYVGFKAWDKYIGKIEALEKADDEARNDAMLGNSWIYECLARYRGIAAEYLRAVAHEFEPEAAAHLRKAGELYERMSNEVLQGDKSLWDIAPQRWTLKEGETWTSEMRQEQIGRLKTALTLEHQAIKEIEKALAAMAARGGV